MVTIIGRHFHVTADQALLPRRREAPWIGRKTKNREGEEMSTLISWLEAGRRLAERIPYSLVALVARFAVASVFWRSGQTKVEGFLQIKSKTFFLFHEEYRVPLLPPDVSAYMTTIAEHVFPVLLVVGLASRLSALGLMIMTLVIQVFVYPDGWPEHILWFASLLLIIARGPGAISLDHLVWTRAQPEPTPAR